VLADCAAARLDTARTARLLGVSEPVFAAWTKRLAEASAEEERAMAAFLARPREEEAAGTHHRSASASIPNVTTRIVVGITVFEDFRPGRNE
jgi:hypothetical protein